MTDQPQDILGQRARALKLRTLLLLRWLAVGGQTATVLGVEFILGFDTPLAGALAVIAASAWLNLFLSAAQAGQRILTDREAAAQLVFDVAQLSLLTALTGGLANPFVVLLAAPVVIAFSTMRAEYALSVAAFTLACTGAMALRAEPLPWFPDQTFTPHPVYLGGLWTALVVGAGFMSVFVWRAAADGRRMSEALSATQMVLAREQRLSALGGLAAAAAHELGTPLGTIQVVAKEIRRSAPPGSDLAEDAELLQSQADRCREILRQLSRRGAEDDAVHAQLSLRALIEEVTEPLRGIGPEIEIRVEPPPAEGVADQPTPKLRRRPEMLYAVSNYLENAIDYADSRIVITGRWKDDWVEVEVRDDGPGFSPDILTKLGEPYVTKREAGKDSHGGLGLGFFIAKTFVERTGGVVKFGNRRTPAHGAIVRARWPLAAVRAPGE